MIPEETVTTAPDPAITNSTPPSAEDFARLSAGEPQPQEAPAHEQERLPRHIVVGGEVVPVELPLNGLKSGQYMKAMTKLLRERLTIASEVRAYEQEYRLSTRTEISLAEYDENPRAREACELYGVSREQIEESPRQRVIIEVSPEPEEIEQYELSLLWEKLEEVIWSTAAMLVSTRRELKDAKKQGALDFYLETKGVDLADAATGEEMQEILKYIFRVQEEANGAKKAPSPGPVS